MVSGIKSFEGLENLKSIGGCLDIYNITSCKGLTKINTLPELNASQVASFEGLENLNIIQGNFCLDDCAISDFTGLNNLQNIGGSFSLSADDDGAFNYGTGSGFNELVSFDGLNNLQTIGKNFEIKYISQNVAGKYLDTFKLLESLEGLTNLTKIGGNFEISTNAYAGAFLYNLRSLKGLDNLKEVGGHFLIDTNNSNNYGSLGELSFAEGPQKLSLIGGDFILSLQFNAISSMEGFCGLEKVNCKIDITNIESFYGLNNLNIINGDFIITSGDTQGMTNLVTIGRNLTVSGLTSSINGLTGLNTINGNLSISGTSMAAINGITQLQKVGGDITISNNSKLEDISGLSGLTGCANVSITNSSKLYNFQPLETAAKNMTGTWYVYGCGYNPTKYQMLNGESKPQE